MGGSFVANWKVEDCFLRGAMGLAGLSRALLGSRGHMAGLPFTCVPTAADPRFGAQPFRVLLLRRLWLALLCSARQVPVWPSTRFQQQSQCNFTQWQLFRSG